MFEADQIVFRIIEGGGFRTGTIARVESVGNAVVLANTASLYNKKTGNEIAPAIPGFKSYIVVLDEGVEKLIKVESV